MTKTEMHVLRCAECGRILCKMASGAGKTELECPKCRNAYSIMVIDGVVLYERPDNGEMDRIVSYKKLMENSLAGC